MVLTLSLNTAKKYYLYFFIVFSVLGIPGLSAQAQADEGVEFKGMLFFEGPENPTYVPLWGELTTVFLYFYIPLHLYYGSTQ